MEFKNVDQNKAFIKNEAKRLGISVKSAYSTYYSRLLLERLAQINYGSIVVKGSFSQIIHLKSLSRPVLDIDLSSSTDHNLPILLLYRAMYEASDDVITFDFGRLPVQTPNGVYKISITATIQYPDSDKRLVLPINVDYKENNGVIFETQYKAVPPIFTGDKKYYINVPSFEEHIAEKLYIIAHNRRTDVLNTRVKDFYDVCKLNQEDFDRDKFTLYFQMMLLMYEGSLGVSSEFLSDDYIQRHLDIWESMKEKYEFVDKDLKFADAVLYAKSILDEQIGRIKKEEFTEQAIQRVRNIKKR